MQNFVENRTVVSCARWLRAHELQPAFDICAPNEPGTSQQQRGFSNNHRSLPHSQDVISLLKAPNGQGLVQFRSTTLSLLIHSQVVWSDPAVDNIPEPLTQSLVDHFETKGYLVLPSFLSAHEISTLRDEVDKLQVDYQPSNVEQGKVTEHSR